MKKLEQVLEDWEAVIGLEIHAELTTLETKMFCSCKLEFGAEPNTHTCPVCLGLPGALPVPNKAAIESIVLAGLATNCDIEKRSMFYRKNYMYPDMAKNFQTTQGPVAFCMRGHLELDVDGAAAKERIDLADLKPGEQGAAGTTAANVTRTEDGYVAHVGIERIHMEEDAGKMIHIGGGEGRIAGATHSLVDYNRAGTPLIELVTKPDLRTPEEARLFMQKLRQIYLAIGISDCSMEEGSLRCDGNVSLRRRGSTELGTKTELKNMNSFNDDPTASSSPIVNPLTLAATALLGATIVLEIITVFRYKKRRLQKRLCTAQIVLLLLTAGVTALYLKSFGEEGFGPVALSVTAALPLVAAILTLLARRGIVKDDKLVRSLDRIR